MKLPSETPNDAERTFGQFLKHHLKRETGLDPRQKWPDKEITKLLGGRTASTFRRWKRGECRPHHTDFAKLLFGLFKERSGENPEALWLREAWEEWPRPVGRPAEGQPAISSEVPIDLERYRARTQAWCLVDVAMLETRGGIDRERPDIRLHEIFVPQDCLTERPPAGEDPAEPRSSRLPCLDAIALPEARLLVLLGEPGAGKSVLARYVALALLGHVPARDRDGGEWAKRLGGRVPFLVELRDYAAMEAEGRCRSLVDYLGQKGETEHYGFDAEQVRATLARLPTLLILDGLDENSSIRSAGSGSPSRSSGSRCMARPASWSPRDRPASASIPIVRPALPSPPCSC